MTQADIQTAIYQALSAVSGMPAVYDDVVQGAAFPYVVVGDDISIPFDDDCGTGFDSSITIHVWSTYSGRKEAKDIMALIYDALHRKDLAINNGYAISMMCDFQETFLDPDGVTRHGVIRFRLLTRSK